VQAALARGKGAWLVLWAMLLVGATPLLSWAEEESPARPLIQRLDEPTRAKVLSALAGLIILGLAMLALTWLGARVTRRYMNSATRYRPPRRTDADLDDWARKPLVKELTDAEDKAGDT
jgi:hypothetical protein